MFGKKDVLLSGMSVFLVFALLCGKALADTVLDRVHDRGVVSCGVDQTPGFGGFDSSGRPVGFDVDFCRAVAAAVLGDAEAIEVRRVNINNKFKALTLGEIDIAFGMTTWTFGRETTLGVTFPVVTFYDGQGFMVWDDDNIRGLRGLSGKSICVQQGTTTAANLQDFLRQAGLEAKVMFFNSSEEKMNGFAERTCVVTTGDRSELSAQRMHRAAVPGQWRILPDTISREPLAAVVAEGDDAWFAIVRWAILTTMIAEARGVNAANVNNFVESPDGELRRLAGGEESFGDGLGLDPQWARRIVIEVGNYGEIFDRNLAPFGLERGLNALWTDGGLIYAPPLR